MATNGQTAGESSATLGQIAAWLGETFPGADSEMGAPLRWRRFPDKEAEYPVNRIGLALDGKAAIGADHDHDALIVHRPFDLPDWVCGSGRPVFALHRVFDLYLTPGRRRVAETFSWLRFVSTLWRTDRPNAAAEEIGWIGAMETSTKWQGVQEWLESEFGQLEQIVIPVETPEAVHEIAFAEAMTPQLIQEADEAGVRVYVTGQVRRAALCARKENQVIVVGTGHRTWEMWGLQQLARELTAAFSGLTVTIYDEQDTT